MRFRYSGLAVESLESGVYMPWVGDNHVRLWPTPELPMSYNAAVMIAKDLLQILVCPACKKELEHRENPESLKCMQCHRVYPVRDDIPIMLVDEATIEAP